ncbi:MAG: M28 family peptidase [bacterium]
MLKARTIVTFVALLLAAGAGCGDDDTSQDGGGGSDGGVGPDAGWSGVCGTDSAEALMACVEQDRWLADLQFVAADRYPGTAHWQAVQDRCVTELEGLGFTVELHDYGTGVNVIGTLTGATLPAERVLLSAHYDHISDCPGADDNASGVAGLFEAVRVLTTASFDRTLVAACWDEEERGLIGSSYYAERALSEGQQLVANYVFEMIGVYKDAPNTQTLPSGLELLFWDEVEELADNEYRGDFIALIHDSDRSQQAVDDLVAMAALIGLRTVALGLDDTLKGSSYTSDLRRSDHASFWELDLPGIMISDTSEFRYPQYHCYDGDDVVANLTPFFATQVVQITVGAAARALGVR